MGKIKSARELALQRAAELTGDMLKEVKPYDHEPYIKAVALLSGSYLEGAVNLERLVEAVGKYPSEAAPAAKAALLKGLTAKMDLDNCEQVLQAFRALKPESLNERPFDALQELHRSYLEHRAARRTELQQGGGLDFLKAKGITGNAIAGINLDRSPLWREAKETLTEQFRNRVQQLKQQLAELF
jgi:hypothetical protein